MSRTASLLLPLLLAACSGIAVPGVKTLSFAEMQSLNPGVAASWILAEYPFARDVDRGPDGRVARMTYWVNDPTGKARGLVLKFDGNEVLSEKQYGGPLIRPPPTPEAGKR